MNIPQEVFNEEFTLEKRKDLFSKASKDVSWNAVACYRYIWGGIDHILSEDEWDPSILNPWVYNQVDFVKSYLNRFLTPEQKWKYNHMYLLDTDPEEIREMLVDILQTEFGVLSHEVQELLLSQKSMMNFILNELSESDALSQQRWYPTSFSPYMSWSIAGFSWYFLDMLWSRFDKSQTVYIEAIIPDAEIIYDDRQKWWEKEIFTTKLKKEWISRVFTHRKQMIKEIFSSDFEYCNTWMRAYVDREAYKIKSEENPVPLMKEHLNFTDIAEHWRFNTDTKMYLPRDFEIKTY